MTIQTPPFTMQQIGTGTARFPSGVAIPTATDAAVDPYSRTKISKHVQVECLQFWPQEKGTYPGIVLLHEWWGLNSQIKDLGARLACEGYGVIIPNLYGRLGGMVTASPDVAEGLMAKAKEADLLQDINSCCEFLNTRDYIKRNIHGVMGFGMGGSFALRFACQRKRLRAAVSFYGRVGQTKEVLKDLYCPVLYHHGGQDTWAGMEEVELLQAAAGSFGKRIDIRAYPEARHAFMNEMQAASFNEAAASSSWDATVAFLKQCFQGA
jgi:carboxymethylenebutenolidase